MSVSARTQTRRDREKLRRLFLPARVQLLFVGESPPASGRFFYSRNSGLYRAMRDAFRTVDSTIDDENFLPVFKDSGCYLTDLSPEPVDHLNSILREAARQSGEKLLSRKIAQLQPVMIAPLLRAISKHVERSAAHAGWQGQILHLPYPGRWIRHRNAFIETLAPTLRELLLNTTL